MRPNKNESLGNEPLLSILIRDLTRGELMLERLLYNFSVSALVYDMFTSESHRYEKIRKNLCRSFLCFFSLGPFQKFCVVYSQTRVYRWKIHVDFGEFTNWELLPLGSVVSPDQPPMNLSRCSSSYVRILLLPSIWPEIIVFSCSRNLLAHDRSDFVKIKNIQDYPFSAIERSVH